MVKKREFVTKTMIIKIAEQLKIHLQQDGDYWSYAEGYSDAKIAEMLHTVANPCTMYHVRNVRLEAFGHLQKPEVVAANVVNVMRAQIDDLRRANDVLQDRFNRLIDNIQLNHVADVKHLKIG